MSVTLNHDRSKSVPTNSTGMAVTALAAEGVNVPADLLGADGVIHARHDVDADDSAGSIIRELFRYTLTPILGANGTMQVRVFVEARLGDESSYTTLLDKTLTHPQNMDVFQTAAGRPRQV